MNAKLLLILAAWAFFFLPAPVRAADNSAVVCGVAIDQEPPFSWSSFKNGPGGPFLVRGDRAGLLRELKNLLLVESTEWPETIRLPTVKSITLLIDGELPFSAFAISKTGDLPPKQYVFRKTAHEIEIPMAQAAPECSEPGSRAARIGVARFVNLVQRCGVELDKPTFKLLANRITALEAQYDKYLYEGFPMFPWEALANSWLLTDQSIANGPPRNQLVFLHPAAGVVVAAGAGADTDVGAALSIEPLGWVHYNRDYSRWYGASLVTVFPGDRNAGIGVALNYNTFKLGVTWHDNSSSDNHRDPTIFLGLELYQFLGKQQRKYQGYLDKVRALKSR